MIKWAGFGKLLKLSFFGLLISCFIGLGGSFVSAGKVQMIGLDSSQSIYSSGFNITFLKGGGLLSSYLGQSKSVIAFNNSSFFWRDSTGQPYFYDTDDIQGYFGQYWSCSELTGFDSVPTNCVSTAIEGDYQDLFKGFFSQVKAGDYAYYNFTERYYYSSSNGSSQGNTVEVCWSSHSIGQSLCFRRKYSYSSNNPGQGSNIGTLVNSQGFTGLNFSNLPYNNISYAPGQAGYNGGGTIDGSDSELTQAGITGNVILDQCTKRKALYWYNSNGYNEKVCYSSYNNNTDIYQGVGSQIHAYALTGTDIKSVWSATSEYRREGSTGSSMGYSQWLDYWRNTYNVYKRNSDTYNNPFVGVPVAIFTQMGNLDVYGGAFDNSSIIDYCNLALYSSDLSSAYSGINRNQICVGNGSLLDYLAGGGFPNLGSSSSVNESGQVVVGSSWAGIISGSNGEYQDGLSFQNGFFDKLTSVYRVPSNVPLQGVLPTYIVIYLGVLILFRFLSH